MDVTSTLDAIRQKIDSYKKEPIFSQEVEERNNRLITTVADENNNLLQVMSKIIAYSNNAPSDAVYNMIERGILNKIFENFDIEKVANFEPNDIVTKYWNEISCIRFKKKVSSIIECAKILKQLGVNNLSIELLHTSYKLPAELKTISDIDLFWRQFDIIIDDFNKLNMPYFKNTTTLLHLLLHLGYPCVKPDLIIMKVAASLGMIKPRPNHNSYNDNDKKHVVHTIQKYCCERNIKPAVMDMYLLVYGGQKFYLDYVTDSCPRLSS